MTKEKEPSHLERPISPHPALDDFHLNLCRDLSEICCPLNNLDIVYFHYIKSFMNGSRISLSNNENWVKHYYDNQYYHSPAIDKTPKNNTNGNYFWDRMPNSLIFQVLKKKFDIANGITLVRKNKTSCDFYYFAARVENTKIYDIYLNHFQLLERFIFYFLDKASHVIKSAEQHPIILPGILPSSHESLQNSKDDLLSPSAPSIKNFVEQTTIRQYRFHENKHDFQLSAQQFECVSRLLEGKNIKDISRELGLSPRTVENYIFTVKEKMNCSRKIDLITKLRELLSKQS